MAEGRVELASGFVFFHFLADSVLNQNMAVKVATSDRRRRQKKSMTKLAANEFNKVLIIWLLHRTCSSHCGAELNILSSEMTREVAKELSHLSSFPSLAVARE